MSFLPHIVSSLVFGLIESGSRGKVNAAGYSEYTLSRRLSHHTCRKLGDEEGGAARKWSRQNDYNLPGSVAPFIPPESISKEYKGRDTPNREQGARHSSLQVKLSCRVQDMQSKSGTEGPPFILANFAFL